MKLFLDENIRNKKLVEKLKKMGLELVFKKQGLSDYDLEDWLVKHDDIVMVTKDWGFDIKFDEHKSFYIDTNESVAGCVILIKHFMSQFNE
jgi:predicted nuclease of predicted toxin-antitoxin system